MATQAKNIQIRLNPNNARDKQVLDYLESMGRNSGEAKRLLMAGFFIDDNQDISTVKKEPKNKIKPRVDNINMASLAG